MGGHIELNRLASHYGLQIVTEESYDPKDTDMTAKLMKITETVPEAIINCSSGQTQSLVLRHWHKLSTIRIPFYQSPAFADREFIKLAGEAAEDVLCPQNAWAIPELLPPNNPQKKVITNYYENYTKRYNEQISSEGSYAWDATKLAIDAMKAVDPHRAEIRDYLGNKKGFVGQNAKFNFSADDHNGLSKRAFYMTVLSDGKWTMTK